MVTGHGSNTFGGGKKGSEVALTRVSDSPKIDGLKALEPGRIRTRFRSLPHAIIVIRNVRLKPV
jgi:hypothetical protein